MTERKKPNNKRLILMIVLLAVVIALMWLLPDGSQPAAPATNAPKTEQTKNTNDAPDDIEATTLVKAGTQAPDFRVEMFDGTTFTLGSLRGKVVLLNFWATWCGPCKALAPVLNELAADYQYKDRIDFYKVDIDQEQELAAVFGVRSVPTLLFIPLSGMPQMMTGGRPKSDLKRIIDEVLMGK